MQTVEIKIFEFDELDRKAQLRGIESIRKEWEDQDRGFDFANWAVDDCSLFEPTHDVMETLLGPNYYGKNDNEFVFKNTREGIEFDVDAGTHNFSKAIEITNVPFFMKWLGVSEDVYNHDNFEWEITGGYETELILSLDIDNPSPDEHLFLVRVIDQFQKAHQKFKSHMWDVLKRIERDIEWRWSNEGIEMEISDCPEDYRFTQSGHHITQQEQELLQTQEDESK